MTEHNKEDAANSKVIGRNEPCPCRSGKKYKRCCGVDAAPKISPPKASSFADGMGGTDGAAGMPSMPGMPGMPGMGGAPGGFGPDMLNQMDPQMMLQLSQALQRLPRGQMQRLQALVQKAMAGKDVSRESAEFEKTLPVELQEMLRGFTAQAGALAGAGMPEGGLPAELPALSTESAPDMSAEEARALVAKAADEGKISKDQAEQLLGGGGPVAGAPSAEGPSFSESKGESSRFSGFFKGLRKK